MIIFLIFLTVILIVIAWVKVRTNKGYPFVLSIGLVATAFFANSWGEWIIHNVNSILDLNIPIPEKVSQLELISFIIFLIITLIVYSFAIKAQKENIVKNTVNKAGEIDQTGRSNLIDNVDNTEGTINQNNG